MLPNKSSHFVRLAIFVGCLWIKLGLISGQQDFQFENTNGDDDVQVVFSETTTEPHYEHRLYEKEISKCGRDENKILLSLILRSHQWNEIIDKKKDKAVNKLSNYFAIPKNAIHLDNVSRSDVYDMIKLSLRRGLSRLNGGHNKYLGRLQFQIGCGKTMFSSQQGRINRIAQDMVDGLISDVAGLEFGLWIIWSKPVNNRVPRAKRDVDEGSGEYDEDGEYYDEDDNEDEDGEYAEEVTEIPSETGNKHKNRHHHGEKDGDEEEEEEEEEYLPNIPTDDVQSSTTNRSTTPPIIYKVQPRNNLNSARTPYIPTTEQAMLTTTTEEPTLPVVQPKSEEHPDESDDYDPDVYDDDDDEYSEYVPSTETPTTTTAATTTTTTAPKIIVPITEPATTTTERSTTTTPTTTDPPTTTPVPTTTEKTTTTTTTEVPITTTTDPPTTTTTTQAPTTTTVPTTTPTTTTEYIEIVEPVNNPPLIKNRMPKQPLTAGKPFSLKIPLDIFYDSEDGTNLKLELLDKHDLPLKTNSWLQFDSEKREIYGLPLEDVVSKWIYHLKATDSTGKSVTEILDLTVQQHKTHRSENHEINIGVRLLEKFRTNVDWQIRLIRGIAETLGETSTSNIVVREIRIGSMDPTSATFVYSNETLPKDRCPEDKLDQVMKRLTVSGLSEALAPEMAIKTIQAEFIGPCKKATQTITETNPSPKNYPPIPRNAVDFIHATVGQLLIYKVPTDTFYDSDDPILKLSLLTADRTPLDPKNWLQFDSKNEEFYGIPKQGDIGQKEYLLVAEDRGGLTATDALVVSVKPQQKRDYSVQFEMSLGIPFENFNNSGSQRRFVERLSSIFNEPSTSNIYVRQIRPIFNYTLVNFYNTTLQRTHSYCPDDEIDTIRNFYTYSDGTTRDRIRDLLGSEFNLLNISFIPIGSCQGLDTIHHPDIITPIHKPSNEPAPPPAKDDYLLTFVLPAVIIISMLIFASVIACYLHRRRLTGKMELGDEEERRSFRSKGIPVIFQDELDEKPEIGNKSPVILKDEKPPLLPPSYNSTNPDDNDDVDDYVPPPAVLMGGRESRGKSPVTPSYRKPPPYVSP